MESLRAPKDFKKKCRLSTVISEVLADAGFRAETGMWDLAASFVAQTGTDPLHIAIYAE